MTFISQVLPIIVIYNQDFRDASSLKVLNQMLVSKNMRMDLFIYDNSKESNLRDKFSHDNFDIICIHDPENAGVSRAYNAGAQVARELKSKKWLLLLDQDTEFPANFLDNYEAAIQKSPQYKIYVPSLLTEGNKVLSPCKYVHKRGVWLPTVPKGALDTKNYSPVNSGMMICLQTFFEAGGYNEKVKLDFADFQFMEKVSEVEDWFFVIDLIGFQDFSGFERDLVKLKHRFIFFCQGAKNCDRKNFLDSWWYFLVVTRRMLGLVLRNRTTTFLDVYMKHYILNSTPS